MRKPFFKAVVAGMASVAMIAGMSACGRSANNADSDSDAVKTIDSSKATGDLTIWAMGNEGDLLGDFVKGFKKENPDVKVKVTAIPCPPRTTSSRPPSPRAMAPISRRWAPPG